MVHSTDTIVMTVIRAEGTPDERLEETASSLRRELNEVQRGVASIPHSGPAPAGAKGDLPAMAQVALAMGTMASPWVVPLIETWLRRQPAETGIILSRIDDDGREHKVTISQGMPEDVVREVTSEFMGWNQV